MEFPYMPSHVSARTKSLMVPNLIMPKRIGDGPDEVVARLGINGFR